MATVALRRVPSSIARRTPAAGVKRARQMPGSPLCSLADDHPRPREATRDRALV